MTYKRYCLFFILAIFGMAMVAHAQTEMQCMVSISTPGMSETDRERLRTLQTSLNELINQRNWTEFNFQSRERIEASISINISERIGGDEYRATLSVQSRRPVYRTSYDTPVFNHQDRDFYFRYVENQPIEYADGVFTSNLTAVLAFYVYVIIGIDFDTFAPFGGNPYFEKAQNIVNLAQNTPERGWKSYESQRNRYWLMENIFNTTYRGIRQAMYHYHRQGFDTMTENVDLATTEVVTALEMLQRAHRERPGSFLMQIVMTTKGDELVNLFSQAQPMERTKAITILTEIDPANSAKYRRMAES